MALSELNVTLGLITRNFERGLRSAEKSLARFERQVTSIGSNLTESITVPLAGLAGAALTSFAQFEKSANALTAVTGSASATAEQIERLREIAKLPGLGFQEAVQASARLQAVGLSAESAEAAIAAYGNAVARSGGGRAEFDGAILALTQIASKGKISAEEINQLNERIFEIRPALTAAFGTADSEQLQKLGISAEEFIARTTAELAKLQRVQGGLANAFENLGDSVRTSLAELGNEINRALNVDQFVSRIGERLDQAVQFFKNLDDATKANIVRFGLFAAAIGPALLAIGKIVSLGGSAIQTVGLLVGGLKNLASAALTFASAIQKGALFSVAALGPIAAIAAAVGVAALAYNELRARVERATAVSRALADVNTTAAQSVAEEKVQVERLSTVLQDETATREQKKRAIDELNRISPEYFGNLDAEKTGADDAKAATDRYIESLLRLAKVKAAQDRIVEIERELLSIRDEAARGVTGFERVTSAIVGLGTAGGVAGARLAKAFDLGANADALNRQRDALEGLIRELSGGDVVLPGASGGNIDDTTFDRTSKAVDKIAETLRDVNAELLAVNERAKLSGDGFDLAAEKMDVLAGGIEKLISVGATAGSPAVQGLIRQVDELRESAEELSPILSNTFAGVQSIAPPIVTANAAAQESFTQLRESTAAFNEQLRADAGLVQQQYQNIASIITGPLQEGFSGFFDTILSGGQNAFRAFGDVLKKIVAQLIKAVATALVLTAIFSIFTGGGAAAALGKLGFKSGSLFGNLFKGVVGFADGGIVTKPTLGLIGEAGENEAIIPLSRLPELIGQMQPAASETLVARVSGDDLLILVERAQRNRTR